MTMATIALMETVSKGALKAKMLEYLRRVEETGEELIVTDNNRPVLRIVPIRTRIPADTLFADVRGRGAYSQHRSARPFSVFARSHRRSSMRPSGRSTSDFALPSSRNSNASYRRPVAVRAS